MAGNDSCNESGDDLINTREAARRLELSQSRVCRMCAAGEFRGAQKSGSRGSWRIPTKEVDAHLRGARTHSTAAVPSVSTFSRRLSRLLTHARKHPAFAGFMALAALATFAFSAVQGIGAWPAAQRYIAEQDIFPAFPSERSGESLVIVAAFYRTEGVIDTGVNKEIARAIEQARGDRYRQTLRVETVAKRLEAEDRQKAEQLGRRHNASMVIWGEDTGVRLEVRFLNLRGDQFDAANVRLSETERTQLARPDGYNSFVTHELPKQMTFFALFALGQMQAVRGDILGAAAAIEEGLASLEPETVLEGVAAAYSHLGWLYALSDDLPKAIDRYNKAIDKGDLSPNNYLNRGAVRFHNGDSDGAMRDYDEAARLAPADCGPLVNKGLAYYWRGLYDEATQTYTDAVNRDRSCYPAYVNRANVLDHRGREDQALADYATAIQLAPNRTLAYVNRAIVLGKNGDLGAAEADLKKALQIQPDSASAWLGLGEIKEKRSDWPGAALDYTRAINAAPAYRWAYYRRSQVRVQQHDYAGAVEDLTQVIRRTPVDPVALPRDTQSPGDDNLFGEVDEGLDMVLVYQARGEARWAQGDLRGAINDFTETIQRERAVMAHIQQTAGAEGSTDSAKRVMWPFIANLYLKRAAVHKQLGEDQLALADYNAGIAEDGFQPALYNDRGNLKRKLGDYQGAIDDFTAALDPLKAGAALDNTANAQVKAMIIINRGMAEFDAGRFDAALQDFDTVLKTDPNDARAHLGRGLVIYQLGNKQEAFVEWARYLQAEPNGPESSDVRSWLAGSPPWAPGD